MNNSIVCGRIMTVPKLSLIQLDGRSIYACKIVIAVNDGAYEYSDATEYKENKVDFFECVAFESAAKMINSHFVKGSKIICMGKFKNHIFEDVNKTKHFTNILLIQQVEYGDTQAMLSKYTSKKKASDISIVSDLKELDDIFDSICKYGFLCVDEDDYYNIAMMNM